MIKFATVFITLAFLMGCGNQTLPTTEMPKIESNLSNIEKPVLRPSEMTAPEFAKWMIGENPFPEARLDIAVLRYNHPHQLFISFSTRNVRPEKMQQYTRETIKEIFDKRDEIDYVNVSWTHLREGKWDPFELRVGVTIGQLDNLDSPNWRNEIDRYVDY